MQMCSTLQCFLWWCWTHRYHPRKCIYFTPISHLLFNKYLVHNLITNWGYYWPNQQIESLDMLMLIHWILFRFVTTACLGKFKEAGHGISCLGLVLYFLTQKIVNRGGILNRLLRASSLQTVGQGSRSVGNTKGYRLMYSEGSGGHN